jgi:23S rRNA (guanosine2251-2'-O)-methyltransferase
MKDLMKVMKRGNINFHVPVEKLNRLTPITIKVLATISISFFDLESLIESVIENGKTIVLILDQISDAILVPS